MRKFLALVASSALVLTLTACSSDSSGGNCEPLATSGSAVDKIKVEGGFGAKPTVEFATPLRAEKTERKVLVNGSGMPANLGDLVTFDYSLYNGDTGEELPGTAYDGSDAPQVSLSEDGLLPGLLKALTCSTPGSQVVAALSPADLQIDGQALQGLEKDASLVLVADIVSTTMGKANGTPQPPVDGMPTVVLAEDGTPGVTIPKTDTPTELEVAVLKKGDGEKVTKDSTVLVHYSGYLWKDGSLFDSSWVDAQTGAKKNQPASFSMTGVIPGFTQALVGQTVGSQILAVIPSELGYQDGETRVFVVDILGIE